jgi:hypothetical protein
LGNFADNQNEKRLTKLFFIRAHRFSSIPTTGDSTDYANRLQVRINKDNQGIYVGAGTDPGDFKIVLLDINPFYKYYYASQAAFDPAAYPARWTRFEATVSGLTRAHQNTFCLSLLC